MSQLVLENVSKSFGKTRVLEGLSLEMQEGEFLSLLGPSGCGKTTALRLVAGLLEPDGGKISIGDKTVSVAGQYSLPPEERQIGMVFQSYALWPHMKVGENVGYPLKIKKAADQEIRTRISAMLELVDLKGFEDRYPHQLSGGQQQRVALARALVSKPLLLLLDEPLSNLDAKLRERMRTELKLIQESTGASIVYVTHDQVEALTLSDRVAVMHNGRLQQLDSPQVIYERPANAFVADFVGGSNLIPAIVANDTGDLRITCLPGECGLRLSSAAGLSPGLRVFVAARPESIELVEQCEPDSLPASVVRSFYRGREIEYLVTLGTEKIRALSPGGKSRAPGERVNVVIRNAHVVPA